MAAKAKAFRDFVVWAMQEGAWQGGDLDGGAMQDKAEAIGLLDEVPYDPKKHGESEHGAKPGDKWYVVTRVRDV